MDGLNQLFRSVSQTGSLYGFLAVLLVLTACEPPDPSLKPQSQNTPSPVTQLTLNNATLEQTNAKGQNLWKLQVQEAEYSPDRKNAKLTKLKGDLYENGKVVLKVAADQGEINEDGAVIVLRNNIVAVDPRNKAVLRSQEIEWRPKDSVLKTRQPLKGSHRELEVVAQQGSYDTKQQQLTLTGKVEAVAPKKSLTLKTEELRWDIPKHLIKGEKTMTLARYHNQEITDQVISQKTDLNLKQKEVLVRDPIEFKSLKPPLQISGKDLKWQYEKRLVESQQPLQILDYQNQVTVTGNRGKVDLNQNKAWLTDGTKSISQAQESQLFANQLTWDMQTQTLEALGNVVYEQKKGVKFNLTGDKAVGSLVNNQVQVTSDRPERVVTEIYPSPKGN